MILRQGTDRRPRPENSFAVQARRFAVSGGFVNIRLLVLVLLFGAVSLANVAGNGILIYRLGCTDEKLRKLQNLQVQERLERLEMLVPKPLVPRLEARAMTD